jgi:hypothetical protein
MKYQATFIFEAEDETDADDQVQEASQSFHSLHDEKVEPAEEK